MADLRRFDDAMKPLEAARLLDPDSPATFNVAARCLAAAGRDDEAREELRRGIRLGVDNPFAMNLLMTLAPDRAQRIADLKFIREQLETQVTFGDGVIEFRAWASRTLEPNDLLAMLREAHAARPDLWAYAATLIRQLGSMNQLTEAAEVAEQTCKKFPFAVGAWLDRAWIAQLRADRAGELDALRQAIAIPDGGANAYPRFADALIRQGEYEQARVMLDRAIARDPLNTANHEMLVQVHWHAGREAEAYDLARRSIPLATDPRRLWEWLAHIGPRMNPPRHPAELAREQAAQRPNDVKAWLTLARLLDSSADFHELVRALQNAVRLSPMSVECHDLYAETLALGGFYDDALAACAPPQLARRNPVLLRGRAAWIEYERGNIEKGQQMLREVLEVERDFAWGWRLRSSWSEKAGDAAQLLNCATQLIRLMPNDPTPIRWKAVALCMEKKRREAKELLSQMLLQHPDYDYGWRHLFDLQMEDKEYEPAGKTLERVTPHISHAAALLMDLRLNLYQRGMQHSRDTLDRLIATSNKDAIVEAGEILRGHFDSIYAERLLHAASQPDASFFTASLAIAPLHRAGRLNDAQPLINLALADPKAGQEVLVAYLNVLGNAGLSSQLHTWMFKHRALLRADTRLWGNMLYALQTAAEGIATAIWARGWQSRPDAKPWMLYNYFICLQNMHLLRSSFHVAHHALTLPPDHLTPTLACWAVLDLFRRGRTDEAIGLFADRKTQATILDHFIPLRLILKTVVEYEKRRNESPDAAFKDAEAKFAKIRIHHASTLAQDKLIARAMQLSKRYVGRRRGGFAGLMMWMTN